MDLLILDIIGKYNPSVAGLHGDDGFQAEETVADQQQAQSHTSVLPADIPSPSSVRDETTTVTKGGVEFMPEKVIFLQYT
jgi:hypothetical protein